MPSVPEAIKGMEPIPGPLTMAQMYDHIVNHRSLGAHGHTDDASAQLSRFHRAYVEYGNKLERERFKKAQEQIKRDHEARVKRLEASKPSISLGRVLERGNRGYVQLKIVPTEEAKGFVDVYQIMVSSGGAWASAYGASLPPEKLPTTTVLRLDPRRKNIVSVVAHAGNDAVETSGLEVHFDGLDAQALAEQEELKRKDAEQKRLRLEAEEAERAAQARIEEERRRQAEEAERHKVEAAKRVAEAERQRQEFLKYNERNARVVAAPPSFKVVKETRRSVLFEIDHHEKNACERFQVMRSSASGTVAAGRSYGVGGLPRRTWRRKRSGPVDWWVMGSSKYGRVNSTKITVQGR